MQKYGENLHFFKLQLCHLIEHNNYKLQDNIYI
jgi:hypothetical protein